MQQLALFNIHSISRLRHAVTMMFLTALLFTAFVVTSPSALAQGELTPGANGALQQGIAAAKFKDWDSAQEHFDHALSYIPVAPEVLFNLGLLNDRKGGAELVASAWFRAYLAAVPLAQNRAQIEAKLTDLHASAEARAAKYLATAREAAKRLAPTVTISNYTEGYTPWPGGEGSEFFYCKGGFGNFLRSEVISGHLENVDEIISWFQGNECQNAFLYTVVLALFAQEQPHEASRYIEKISGPWKISALNLFAAIKWREGDKTGAIKLVEKTEAVTTQLLKGYGKNTHSDKYNILRLRSEMAIAWCRVGNIAKARRALERVDPNLAAEIGIILVDDYFNPKSWFGRAFKTVSATLISTGKEKEAKAVLRAIVSKIRYDWPRKQLQSEYQAVLYDLISKSREDLVASANNWSLFENVWSVNYDWSLKALGGGYHGSDHDWVGRRQSSQSNSASLELKYLEEKYWTNMAKGSSPFDSALIEDLYRDGGKFLATASGTEAEDTIVILFKGSTDLLLASRMMKESAADWRKFVNDPAN